MKTLKFTVKTMRVFKNSNKWTMEFQNSEGLVTKQSERRVSMNLYLNPELNTLKK